MHGRIVIKALVAKNDPRRLRNAICIQKNMQIMRKIPVDVSIQVASWFPLATPVYHHIAISAKF